jgi:hypothetical protein
MWFNLVWKSTKLSEQCHRKNPMNQFFYLLLVYENDFKLVHSV